MAINLSTLLNQNPAQIVTSTITSTVSTGSLTYVSTGLSASITPKSTTSNILVLISGTSAGGSGTAPSFVIYRNSTNICSNYVATTGNVGISYLDSPNTISSTTYTLYFANNSNPANPVYFNYNNALASITLVEVN
jgi:hypothetical protein